MFKYFFGTKKKSILKGMGYFRKVAASCEELVSISRCLSPKYMKYCFQNLENGGKDKKER